MYVVIIDVFLQLHGSLSRRCSYKVKVRAYTVTTRLANLGWEFWKTGTEAEKRERVANGKDT